MAPFGVIFSGRLSDPRARRDDRGSGLGRARKQFQAVIVRRNYETNPVAKSASDLADFTAEKVTLHVSREKDGTTVELDDWEVLCQVSRARWLLPTCAFLEYSQHRAKR